MRILAVHSAYLGGVGGEDLVYKNETALLRRYGHEVFEYVDDNRRIPGLGTLRVGAGTIWSRSSYRSISKVLAECRPDIAHFHNTFPLISPSAYYAAKKYGAAVVQTLHNFRLLCPNGIFLREGKVCEDCLTKSIPYPGVLHGCYRNSRAASAGVASMVAVHRALGTWRHMVDIYLALSEFSRAKFVEGGLPTDKIIVKPNCVTDDPGPGTGDGDFALYVGRLSPEKGIATLLAAWETIGDRIPLKVVGDGPESARVRKATERVAGIERLGPQPYDKVMRLLKDASFVVIPSICYENFPLVAAEAFAAGTPVVASDIGSLVSIVESERTGLRFRTGDAVDLANKVSWLLENPGKLAAMRGQARSEFENKYSAAINYGYVMRAYERALEQNKPDPALTPHPRHEQSLRLP
jgi:glycosyltransferase involved in cell wall biosynthesis